MSHSRQTQHYNLPLYNGTDIINPLTDFNDANDAIDTALYNANQSASDANTKADTAVEAVAGYDTRITQAETKADNALTKNSDTEKMIANQFDPLKDGGYATDTKYVAKICNIIESVEFLYNALKRIAFKRRNNSFTERILSA